MDIFELSTIYCHEKFPSEIIIISYNILLVEELIFAHNFFIRYFMCTIKNKRWEKHIQIGFEGIELGIHQQSIRKFKNRPIYFKLIEISFLHDMTQIILKF